MKQYLELLAEILEKGTDREDRTGTGTRAVFGRQLRFDLREGFPLLTTKKLHLKSIIHELLWFLAGDTSVRSLQEKGVTIWDEWADANGNLGPVYGAQWRNWKSGDGQMIDQITGLIDGIKKNPTSRRHIVSAWNVGELDKMALMPCHVVFQFFVAKGTLSCQLYARSQDYFLGTPFNIASYSLLLAMVAQQCDLVPAEFVWTGGDVHLYNNHVEQALTQLSRTPFPLPKLEIKRRPNSIFDYQYEDFAFIDYQAHPSIKAAISV